MLKKGAIFPDNLTMQEPRPKRNRVIPSKLAGFDMGTKPMTDLELMHKHNKYVYFYHCFNFRGTYIYFECDVQLEY